MIDFLIFQVFGESFFVMKPDIIGPIAISIYILTYDAILDLIDSIKHRLN
jgi:hypothetical protein